MTIYNVTDVLNAKTISDLMIAANNAVNQMFIGGFLMVFFVVIIMSLKKYYLSDAILASSFVCFIASLFLRAFGVISFQLILFFLAVLAFGMMLKFMSTSEF